MPKLQFHKEQSAAGQQQIALAENTLMPDLSAGYQAGFATDNNISGMSYPGLLLPISGPVTTENSYKLYTGTALSLIAKWNPFTFGQRRALVETAKSRFKLSNSQYNEQLFIVQYTAVNTYLELLYLSKAIASLHRNVLRTQINLEQAAVLGRTGLRPGVDSVQFQSTLVQAEMDQLRSEKSYRQQQITLLQQMAVSLNEDHLLLSDSALLKRLPALPDTSGDITKHPLYQFYNAQKGVTAAEQRQVKNSWTPKLDFWGTAYSRGSGINDGANLKSGWALSRNNFGLGLQFSFPLLDYRRWSIQKQQYEHLFNGSEELLKQTSIDLNAQLKSATVALQQNLLIAKKSPEKLNAARVAYQSLQANYQAGRIDYTQLVQGQFDLLNAEIEVYGSYVQAWQSLLNLAVASGDLSIFTTQL
ncbi:MAG: TolC family protein [Chitinophagaceae bacterium]|nr:TolC family protein [Chitinophagaceae bacterium]